MSTTHPSARKTSLNSLKEEVVDATVSVAAKVSRGMDETKELSRIRLLSVESLVSSFCVVRVIVTVSHNRPVHLLQENGLGRMNSAKNKNR